MQAIKNKEDWETYREKEIARALPSLHDLGMFLDEEQVHTGGERYLMSGRKLVLTGVRQKDEKKVVIKVSSFPEGKKEIAHEKTVRDMIDSLPFAHGALLAPREIFFGEQKDVLIFITEYIDQLIPFVTLPLEKQYFFALRVLEEQEGFHATTREHSKTIEKVFASCSADDYVASCALFLHTVRETLGDRSNLIALMEKACAEISKNKTTLERHGNYLTHTDLVPHNMRVGENGIYLIDYAAIHFGNKYEGWARFLNFMLLHNPPLEKLLLSYVQENRTEDEYLSLRLMRMFKVCFLLRFYALALQKTEGDLRTLTEARIDFWTGVLHALERDMPIDASLRDTYLTKRSILRSPEEVARQKEISAT